MGNNFWSISKKFNIIMGVALAPIPLPLPHDECVKINLKVKYHIVIDTNSNHYSLWMDTMK